MVSLLQSRLGAHNVIATDIRKPASLLPTSTRFQFLDVLDTREMERVIVNEGIDWVVHFSALLSFVGEQQPLRALQVNAHSFESLLELARMHKLRVYCPSTIGVFGKDSPKTGLGDVVMTRPATIYGVTKVHAELLGQYYHDRFGVDFRSARYPGIISALTLPGGGTTDYAVDMLRAAFIEKKQIFSSPLPPDARLPMMDLTDCLEGTFQLLSVPEDVLNTSEGRISRVYNMAAISFTPEELADAIRRHTGMPFHVIYDKLDEKRTQIAATWPHQLDDQRARRVWNWKPQTHTTDALVALFAREAKSLTK